MPEGEWMSVADEGEGNAGVPGELDVWNPGRGAQERPHQHRISSAMGRYIILFQSCILDFASDSRQQRSISHMSGGCNMNATARAGGVGGIIRRSGKVLQRY